MLLGTSPSPSPPLKPPAFVNRSLLLLSLLAPSLAQAVTYYNYDSAGVGYGLNGAVVSTLSAPFSSTGSGTFGGYLNLSQNTSVLEGISTSSSQLMPAVADSKTTAIAFSAISGATSTLNGSGSYVTLSVDLNEPNNSDSYISIDSFKIYHAATGNVPATSLASFTATSGVSLVWDMDGAGDTTLLVDEKLSAGSGKGNMAFVLPSSLFSQGGGFYYLYVMVGSEGALATRDYGNAGGFEEVGLLSGLGNINTTAIPTVTPQSEIQVTNQILAVPEVGSMGLMALTGVLALLRRTGSRRSTAG